jgi:NTE family protein
LGIAFFALFSQQCLAADANRFEEEEVPAAKPSLSDVKAIPLSADQSPLTTPPLVPGKHSPKVAFALGGGGTRGAAHIGVLKVLEENGIKPDMIVGTSMGAVVGGLYSAGVPTATIVKQFDDGSIMKAFMTVPLYVRIIVAPVLLLPRAFGYHPYDGLYRGNKFRRYLDRSLPECCQNIEGLKIPFAAVALNVADGKVYALTRGNLGYAMQASSAVPGLRKPVELDQKLFIDGGVMDNVPVIEAKKLGADFVIAVDVDERLREEPLHTFRKIGSVSARTITIQLATLDAPQLRRANIVIHPNVDGIGLISTKKQDARRAIAAGEAAAKEALPLIRQKLSQAGVAIEPGLFSR